MMGLYVKEVMINATEGYRYGGTDDEAYEAWTDDVGKLYRTLQREYGRCTSRVYRDGEGGPEAIGWVFIKRCQYEDTKQSYLREVWVTLHDAPDTVTRTEHVHVIGRMR